MDGFPIVHGNLTLEIAIVKVDDLHPHEEVIPREVKYLSERIYRDNALHHPILVDKNSSTVLDGMHRLAAIKSLGCNKILVCFVDYLNPLIVVHGWYRCYKEKISVDQIEKAKEKMSLKPTSRSLDDIQCGLESRIIDLSILTDNYYILQNGNSIEEIFKIIKQIEKNVALPTFFEKEKQAFDRFQEGEFASMLAFRSLRKGEILKAAVSGYLFPCKTTRHVIPTRPIGIEIPLKKLGAKRLSLLKLNEDLIDELQKRKTKILPAGSVIDGRMYEEELLLF
ncbi:hypothetical protein [[Eubacterium] cellulosolvens]